MTTPKHNAFILPPAEQMQTLIAVADALHAAPAEVRVNLLLRHMLQLFNVDGVSAVMPGAQHVLTRSGKALLPGRTPTKLLHQTRGLSQAMVFTSADLAATGWQLHRPRGVLDVIHSLARPGNGRYGSVLSLYFDQVPDPEPRDAMATALRLLHSSTSQWLDSAGK